MDDPSASGGARLADDTENGDGVVLPMSGWVSPGMGGGGSSGRRMRARSMTRWVLSSVGSRSMARCSAFAATS